MRILGLLCLLVATSWAEVPDLITDPATRDTIEYLDAKINKAQQSIDTLTGATLSTSTILAIANGGTGASTAVGARTNLGVPSNTGTGASGTWPINITGSAATATDSSKVAKTGDTMTGPLTMNGSSITFVNPGSISGVKSIQASSISSSEYWGDISSTTGLNQTHLAMFMDAKGPTGFYDNTTSSITLSGRTFQIAGTNFSLYANGIKLTQSTATITVPNLTQLNWIYYTTSGVLSQSTTFPGFYLPLVATVYYSTAQASGILADERHTAIMDWKTHEYLHETIGTRYASGLSASFFASSATVSSGETYDDDLEHIIVDQKQFIVLYKNGNPYFEFTPSTVAYFTQSGGILQYNNGNTLAPVSLNSYVAYWVFATGNVNRAIEIVTGQREDISISNARANNTLDSLVLTGLPNAEQKLLYRVIMQRTVAGPVYVENADYRSVTNLPGGSFVPTSHASLTNLSLATANHPYDQPGGFASYEFANILSTATGTYSLSTTGRAANATNANNATTVTNGAYVNASNYFTGVNQFTQNTTISNKLYVDEIQMSSAIPSIVAYSGTAIKNILFYPGIEINSSPGYAYNWVLPSTDSIKAKYYDVGLDIGQYYKFDKYGLVVSSGIRAGASRVDGSGGVNIIGSDGKIPALTSAYFANMDGSAITGLSTLDATKVPLGGGTMTGSLIFSPTDISTGQIVFQGGFPHSIQFNNQSATSGAEFLGEVQFLQSGTGKRRIIGFGDTSATYPKELQIGADTTSLGANVRITGSNTLSPDLFVSSWTSVGIGKANPYWDYKLDVAGKVNSSGGFFKNGVEIAAGSGGDSLGSHIATQTLQMSGYNIFGVNNITASTLTVTGSAFSVGGSTLVVANGRVGVGLSNPLSTLSVNGDGTFSGPVTVASSATVGGNIGANEMLTLQNTSIIQNVVNAQTLIGDSVIYDGMWKRRATGFPSAIRFGGLAGGSISFHIGPSASAGTTIANWDTDDVRMSINSAGNVGIGTTGPGYKLDVAGDINTSGAYKINGVAVSGLGNVVLASTQTFSGSNTFQSSTTFQGSIYGSINLVSASTHTIAGTVDIGWETIINTCNSTNVCTADCSTGKILMGGGCAGGGINNAFVNNYFQTNTRWYCGTESTANITVKVICARIKP